MEQERRGRLKIFLGYAAGVGKTYAMLGGARQRKAEGVDVIVALALTHGRKETEKLLEGLEILPTKKISYKGVQLTELDLDRVLSRTPSLALVDELAHTNVPGSRHTKRYMDVEELLDAGIDVYSTLNIQHLESYQDPIEEATGISVRERVPDRILDEADEIELIDIAPEELLERLRQGKVYVPEQAARAIHKFFRKENLQLLREIALRKTAAIVDTDRSKQPGDSFPTQVAPKLLASIGPSPFSERVIRVTKRLADMLKAEWYVVSVETPDASFGSDEERQQLVQHLRLAEELGAKVVTLPGESIADTIFSYAKTRGITQIILGHSLTPWFKRLWRRSPVDELVKKGGTVDIYVISSGPKDDLKGEPHPPSKRHSSYPRQLFFSLALPVGLVALLTFLLSPFSASLTSTSIALIYLISSTFAASFLSPISFYVYIIASALILHSVYIEDLEEWFYQGEPLLFSTTTLIIGSIINHLTTKQRHLATTVVARHQEMLRLFELSRDLAAANSPSAMLARLNQHLGPIVHAEAMLYFHDGTTLGHANAPFDTSEQMSAQWAIEHQESAGFETDTLPSAKGVWKPLTVAERRIGAIGIYPKDVSRLREHIPLIEAFVHLMALSLDRAEG